MDALDFLIRATIASISVVTVIMMLAAFFRVLPRLIPAKHAPLTLSDTGSLFEDATYEATLSSGERIPALRFEGFVDIPSDSPASWPLRGMAVFRTADGRRVILRMEAVRVFREQPS
jgi:hypothetical protein